MHKKMKIHLIHHILSTSQHSISTCNQHFNRRKTLNTKEQQQKY